MGCKLSKKALQDLLVDAFDAAGEGQEVDLYDAICASARYPDDDDETAADDDFSDPRVSAASFSDAGVLTRDAGLVVTIGEREFQITIVRSR